MGLKELRLFDVFPISNAFKLIGPDLDGISPFLSVFGDGTRWCHMVSTDRVIGTWGKQNGGSGFTQYHASLDPDFFDPTSSIIIGSVESPAVKNWAVGTFNPDSGAQRLYASQNLSVGTWQEFNQFTMGQIVADPYTNFASATSTVAASATGGYSGGRVPLLFEGLTAGGFDGIVAGSYPDGLALVKVNVGNLGGGAGTDDDAIMWVNVATGNGVGKLVNPGRFASTGGPEPNTEPPIAGHNGHWRNIYYGPDADATFVAPKGVLVMMDDEGNAAGNIHYWYFRIVEFNPTNKISGQTRTHGRVLLTSRVETDLDMTSRGFNNVVATANRMEHLIYRHNRGTVLNVEGEQPTPSSVPLLGDDGVFLYSIQPELALLSPPTSESTPRTADVTSWETQAIGSLGEPVGGARIDFTLERISTLSEVVDASGLTPGGGGALPALDNPPIDPDTADPPATEGSLVFFEDTGGGPVALVETTDYTVVLSTAVITLIAPKPVAGATYTASYEHRATPATPPHGTLLDTKTTSNEDGRAFTRVQVADNDTLVGEGDRLTATTLD